MVDHVELVKGKPFLDDDVEECIDAEYFDGSVNIDAELYN